MWAAGLGGLPVETFWAAQAIAPVVFRATLIAYFTLLGLWTLPIVHQRGLIGVDTLIVTAVALPIFVLVTWAGGQRFLSTEPKDFRRFAILIMMALALPGLGKALWQCGPGSIRGVQKRIETDNEKAVSPPGRRKPEGARTWQNRRRLHPTPATNR